jgi:hypothetical protein
MTTPDFDAGDDSIDFGDRDRLSDPECETVFAILFPLGFGRHDVLVEIAPAGWERSPLLSVFHPSVEQVHREAVRIHRNVDAFLRARGQSRPEAEPTLEEIRSEWREQPIETNHEVRELVGQCVWDVFSDNHDVIAPDGRVVDIGSFRGAGGFIADLLNRENGERRYGYMDFYLGTIWRSDRADLTAVYAMIFRRLARHGFDWKYTFPRFYAFDPGTSGGAVRETLEQEHERTELHGLLENGRREAIERAKDEPPPRTVHAYRQIYHRDPQGWPPWE